MQERSISSWQCQGTLLCSFQTFGFGIPRLRIPMCNIQGTVDQICASWSLETFVVQHRDDLWDCSLFRLLVFGILLIRDIVMKSNGAEPSREPCHKLPTQRLYQTSRHDSRCKFKRKIKYPLCSVSCNNSSFESVRSKVISRERTRDNPRVPRSFHQRQTNGALSYLMKLYSPFHFQPLSKIRLFSACGPGGFR